MTFFLIAMFGGFAGSFHCIGMCGGFACGLGGIKTNSRSQLLLKNTLYNVGRLTSYTFIGALAGTLGAALISSNGSLNHAHPPATHSSGHFSMPMIFDGDAGLAQSVLSIVAGALMLLMALQLLSINRFAPPSWGRIGGIAIARVLNSLVRSDRLSASVALGVANGFLPCPLVLAFASIAAASGSVVIGALTMAAFGLGTFPAMILMGLAGTMLSPLIRQRGVRLSGLFVLSIGVITIIRGIVPGIHGIM